jgi:hypothetical protein
MELLHTSDGIVATSDSIGLVKGVSPSEMHQLRELLRSSPTSHRAIEVVLRSELDAWSISFEPEGALHQFDRSAVVHVTCEGGDLYTVEIAYDRAGFTISPWRGACMEAFTGDGESLEL